MTTTQERNLEINGVSPTKFSGFPFPEDGEIVLTHISFEKVDEVDISVEQVEGIPLSLISAYAQAAARHAAVREVDAGVWVASVVGLDGAYSDADSESAALADLPAVIADWVAMQLRTEADIPVIDGLDVNTRASE